MPHIHSLNHIRYYQITKPTMLVGLLWNTYKLYGTTTYKKLMAKILAVVHISFGVGFDVYVGVVVVVVVTVYLECRLTQSFIRSPLKAYGKMSHKLWMKTQ